MKRNTILVIVFFLLFAGCGDRDMSLDENSVIRDVVENNSFINKYINDNFTPYNIVVRYKWDVNSTDNAYLYPPQEKNIIGLLKTIKSLWLDVYSRPKIGGEDFIRKVAPREIYLYGGKNIYKNNRGELVEIITSSGGAIVMPIYRVDDFDVNNKEAIRILMRMVHHNYAKLLIEAKPFDRQAFSNLNQYVYKRWEEEATSAYHPNIYDITSSNGAYRYGYYSHAAQSNVEQDFIETLSVILTHSRSEVDEMLAKSSLNARKILIAKSNFLVDYFKKNWDINLLRMQSVSSIETQKFLR